MKCLKCQTENPELNKFCRIYKVHSYEGTVNEMTADGIVALFGAPIALARPNATWDFSPKFFIWGGKPDFFSSAKPQNLYFG